MLSSSRGQANFRGLEGLEAKAKDLTFEAKAKDFKMCPRGQGRPRGLHLCHFLTDLADNLILPHMKTRQKIPQLQKATKEAMTRCCISFSNTSPPQNILQNRKRCSLCPHTKDRKVAKCCSRCSRHVCPEHSITTITCSECYE